MTPIKISFLSLVIDIRIVEKSILSASKLKQVKSHKEMFSPFIVTETPSVVVFILLSKR